MNPALLDLDLSSTSWQDQGSNLLTNGDFEGAAGPPPAGWTAFQCVATREAGARTGGSGSYIGRIAYDGANPYGTIYQTMVPINRRYSAFAWMRSDGAAQPQMAMSGSVLWNGIASASWQSPVSPLIFVPAAGNFFYLQSSNLAAGRYVDADDASVYEQFLYTRAQGTLAQTPSTARVQLGDGRTAATFPTQLGVAQGVLRGMSFDGGDYLQWLSAIPAGTYTACMLVSKTAAANSKYLFDARLGGGTGYLWVDAGGTLAASGGTTYVDEVATSTLNVGPVLFVAVSGISMSVLSGIVFGASFVYGSQWIGPWYGFRLFPGTLTPRQLRDQRQRMLSRVHGP